MGQTGTPATHGSVHELAVALALDDVAYRRAVDLAGLVPDRRDWQRFLDRFLIAVGALLIVAGIAAFFAWNWADLHHMAKFALIQGGIAAAVLIAWRLKLDSIGGGASLFAAAFLVGVLFAVFGQVYQTGADPYGLFLVWAVLILPWAIIGRQPGLWLLFQLLLNLTLILYWIQVLHPPDGWWQVSQLLGPLVWLATTVMDSRLASCLFALNASAVVTWELAANRGIAWLQGRTYPRVLALIALYTVLGPTVILIFGAANDHRVSIGVVSPLLFAAAVLLTLWYYQYRKLDLFMLTAALFGSIFVVMSLAIRFEILAFGGALFLALLLIGQVAGAAVWLRSIAERRQVAG
jgi:uncharacterized membrane protein